MSQPEPDPRILPASKRGCRPVVIGLLALGVLGVTGLVVGWLVLQSSTNSRYARAVAEADRQDPEGWRLEDLLANRFEPPEGNNPADRVQEAYDLLPPEPWRTSRTPDSAVQLDQEGQSLLIGDVLEQLGEPSNRRLDDEALAVLSGGLDGMREALEVARPLAETGEGRFPLVVAFNPLETRLPGIQNARDVARLLKLDASRRALDGDLPGALESCRATLGVARAIGDEPMLVSQLVRTSIDGVALGAAEYVLGQGEAPDDALAAFQDQLATEASQPLILHAIRGERAANSDLIGKLESGQLDLGGLTGGGAGPGPPRRIFFSNPAGRLYFRHNRALFLETMNDARAIAALPLEEQYIRWQEFRQRFEMDKIPRLQQLAGTLVYLLVPGLSAAGEAEVHRVAQLRAMIVLMAAERHRLAHGDWPAAPDDLGPWLPGGRVPIDPYTSRPILIRRVDDGLVAYSASVDRADDGGRIDPRRDWRNPGYDAGFRLWDAGSRGLPPDPLPVPKDRVE